MARISRRSIQSPLPDNLISWPRRKVVQEPDGGKAVEKVVAIKPPNFREAVFTIVGISPLVGHRFSEKVRREMEQKMKTGKEASKQENRDPQAGKSFLMKTKVFGIGFQ